MIWDLRNAITNQPNKQKCLVDEFNIRMNGKGERMRERKNRIVEIVQYEQEKIDRKIIDIPCKWKQIFHGNGKKEKQG